MAILKNVNGSTMKIEGSFTQVKSFFCNKGQTVRESRTCSNGEDVFFNGKMMGVLLFDGEVSEKYYND